MKAEDDKKSAVLITVTLSSQLITASLAMLTVEGAYVAYALDKREPSNYFEFIALLSAAFFILSIFMSGKAITMARNAGFSGDWNLNSGKSLFNYQAIFNGLGLILFVGTVLLSGNTAKDLSVSENNEDEIRLLEHIVKINTDKNNVLEKQNAEIKHELENLRSSIEENKDKLSNLNKNPNKGIWPYKPSNMDKKLPHAPFFPSYR